MALGIELELDHRNLRLVCPSSRDWKLWMRGLVYAQRKAISKIKGNNTAGLKSDIYRKLWDIADEDNSGSIHIQELMILVRKCKIEVDMRYLIYLFVLVDEDKTRVLEYAEFRRLLILLGISPTIRSIFLTYKDPIRDIIRLSSIETMLLDIQHEDPNRVKTTSKFIENVAPNLAEPAGITELGFNNLMRSKWNELDDTNLNIPDNDLNLSLESFWIYSVKDPFARCRPKVSPPV